MPGIKAARGDLILAGALVVQCVMEAGGFEALEVTEAGLREGVFYETLLGDLDPPLIEDVRRASVLNLASAYGADFAHVDHVARLALELWEALGSAGLHSCDPLERDLLWSAAMLHDIGTAVDYDDHHKHSRYLILSAGLPGHTPRETGLIGQLARYHRKGSPGLGEFSALARDGDEEMVERCAAVLRLAEQLERPRDQTVEGLTVDVHDGTVALRLRHTADVTVARWAAERESALFKKVLGRELEILDDQFQPGRPDSSCGVTVTSSRSETASTTSSSSASSKRSSSGSASQVTRIIPVATRSSPTTTRPQMTSPSSQPIRSTSNQERCTWVPLPPHGQVLSWCSLALQTACMFLAEASMLMPAPRVPPD